MAFGQRFQILYQASSSELKGYAIRKREWMNILGEFKDFSTQIKRKSFDFFVCQIYRPLMIQKNQDIEEYDKRKDYEQVLAIADKDMI